MGFAAIILAAGQGKRMKSDLPKVLHPLRGELLVNWVVKAAREAGADKIVVVVGYGKEQVVAVLPKGVEHAVQAEQLGTGHAARSAEAVLKDYAGPIAVLCGDVPLLRAESIKALAQAQAGAAAAVLTAQIDGEHAYGRIVRDAQGSVRRIVENKDANAEEKQIGEINTGTYVFAPGVLFEALGQLKNNNAQKEYYLTDTVAYFTGRGQKVAGVKAADAQECLGINTPEELAAAELVLQRRAK